MLPWGWVRGAGDEHSLARHPPRCLPAMGAACREPQPRGARCQPRRLGTATRAARPRRTPARTLLAARRWPRRSPEGPGSARASRAPSRPCRAPCLPASQCPGPASSLSLSPPTPFFFFFFFSLSPSFTNCRRHREGGGERGGASSEWEAGRDGRRAGGVTAPPVWKEMGAHPAATTLPEKSLPSLPPSVLCSTPQRRRGRGRSRCQAGSMSPMGGSALPALLCLGACPPVPAPAAQRRGVPRPGGAGTPGPLQHELSHHFSSFPASPQGPAVTHRAGWPGPGVGVGGEPVRRLSKTQRWPVMRMRSSVAQTLSGEACGADVLSGVDSLRDGERQ